ncbi:MAG: hypothetical protein JSS32_07535 [Verrucomicrobia bacterium]|nr:hypothetical protein [Verrucomicrobiota bacterium]
MLMGDPTGILDEKKRYMNPVTGAVYTGKGWLKVVDRSRYDIFDAEWLRSFIEVERDKTTKEWVKVDRSSKNLKAVKKKP